MNWNELLLSQITWHWDHQLRDRLAGLTDAEYFWEPAPNSWNVRPRGTSTAPVQGGSGAFTIDLAMPEPTPPPVTTIAWRLGHVIVGVLAARNAAHFGREPTDYFSFAYAPTAAEALTQLDTEYATWLAGVEKADLTVACGDSEGPHGHLPMAALVLHIHRELIHHLSEISLLRDLHRTCFREEN
ncbi:DinB family protein [Actinoplanes sp. TFC3]|uniref:DinB family protein n=1 Tax=Actinoplanes sp. TFC3 TaxID=1710355 RepID=UPI00082CA5A0|nr:DinB family protein [Actinoplanes sp. TFC3]